MRKRMVNILIELSNKTSEIMADNLVTAFTQRGISPVIYRLQTDGQVVVKSDDEYPSKLAVLSEFIPDSYRSPYRAFQGTRLYKAMVANGLENVVDAFILFNDGGGIGA